MISNTLEISSSIIGGKRKVRRTFNSTSLYYPDYTYEIADASALQIARAIGCTKTADRSDLKSRMAFLEKAAQSFSFEREDVEHVVKLSGMPISLLQAAFENIPGVLTHTSAVLAERFGIDKNGDPTSTLSTGVFETIVPDSGFCYAVTPGNDPRVTAIVAANLCFFGIPFVIKASKEDKAAQLVISALIEGGFDPNFCNLVYFDSQGADSAGKHFKLLEACSTFWVYGSDQTVDETLRFEHLGNKLIIPAEDIEVSDPENPNYHETIAQLSPRALKELITVERNSVDHFKNKRVLRHGTGNCATIFQGEFDENTADFLYRSTAYTIGCNTTKTGMLVNAPNWAADANDYLQSLTVGDPLDPATEVGFVHPVNLEYLENLIEKNSQSIKVSGFKKYSDHQCSPLVIETQSEIPALFTREISAFVLGLKKHETVHSAMEDINHYSPHIRRLAVSLYNLPENEIAAAIRQAHSFAVFVNEPTTHVISYYHEGNDYPSLIADRKLNNYRR